MEDGVVVVVVVVVEVEARADEPAARDGRRAGAGGLALEPRAVPAAVHGDDERLLRRARLRRRGGEVVAGDRVRRGGEAGGPEWPRRVRIYGRGRLVWAVGGFGL